MKKSIALIFLMKLIIINALAQMSSVDLESATQHKNVIFNNNKEIRVDSVIKEIYNYKIKWLYYYNSSGKVIREYFYQHENNVLIQAQKSIYNYNSYGDTISLLIQSQIPGDTSWINSHLCQYEYDNNNNLTSLIYKNWNNDNWENRILIINNYDNSGLMILKIYQEWEINYWQNIIKDEYVYDTYGNNTEIMHSGWKDNEWQQSVYYLFSYDSNNNKTEYLWKLWKNNEWVNYKITTYSYNNNQKVLELLKVWEDGNWINNYRKTYNFNSNDKIISSLSEQWYNNSWFKYIECSYDYFANGMPKTILTNYYFNGEFSNKKEQYFNENGQLTYILNQRYDYDQWINVSKVDYQNEESHINGISFEWYNDQWLEGENIIIEFFVDGEEVFSNNGSSADLYYSDLTGVEENDQDKEQHIIQIYPNPIKNDNYLIIESENNIEIDNIEIKNISGQILKTISQVSPTNQQLKIDISELSTGVYLVIVKTQTSLHTNKLIVAKQ